jgi:hypothetical protein
MVHRALVDAELPLDRHPDGAPGPEAGVAAEDFEM